MTQARVAHWRKSSCQISSRQGGSIPPARTFPRQPAIRWGQYLGQPDCPYARRWVLTLGAFSIRLHHWIGSDDPRNLHDHPWWFITVVLRGGYRDVTDQGEEHLRAFTIRKRSAEHRHTVQSDPGGAWTFLITGPQVRWWGYWVNGKLIRANRYFRRFGLHPCD